MSEIARWDLWDGQMSHSVSGLWVRYAAHQFEVERLATELAEAHERCRALELAAEQADEMKAHAEASAAAEETETDRVTAERDAAQAEVERLWAKVHELDHKLETAQIKLMTWHEGTSLDPAAQLRADVARLTTERDAARAEIERLTQELEGRRATNQRVMAERDSAQREVERLQIMLKCERDEVAQLRDRLRVLRANGQGMLDTSRPTDEDIWREGFMRCLNDVAAEDWHAQADLVLTTYRKRWPR